MAILFLAGLIFILPRTSGSAKVLFAENWNRGTIDTARWIVNPDSLNSAVAIESVGAGDNALALRGTLEEAAPSWKSCLFTRQAFQRARNLRCTFKVWHKDLSATADVCCAFQGPWYWWYTLSNSYCYAEAIISASTTTRPIFVFKEAAYYGPGGFFEGPTLTAFNSAWPGARNKDQALTVRVRLGDQCGAKMEFSPDGGKLWTTQYDALGSGPGNGNGLNTGCYVGFSTWGSDQSGTTLIDDISVEEDDQTTVRDWRFYP